MRDTFSMDYSVLIGIWSPVYAHQIVFLSWLTAHGSTGPGCGSFGGSGRGIGTSVGIGSVYGRGVPGAGSGELGSGIGTSVGMIGCGGGLSVVIDSAPHFLHERSCIRTHGP